MLITVYFIMLAVGGLLFFPVPDRIGRKKTHYVFSTIHLAAQFACLLQPNYWVRMLSMGVLGLTMVKNSLCYVWLFEFMIKQHKSSSCLFINMFDESQMLIACFYFFFIGDDWYPICLRYCIVASVAFMLITALIPESPKWLLL